MPEKKRKTPLTTLICIALASLGMLVILAAIAGGFTVYFATKDYNDIRDAIEDGDTFAVRCFLLLGADVNEEEWTDRPRLLDLAVRCRDRDMVELLLDKGADVNVMAGVISEPLREAVLDGDMNIATLLIDRGADMAATDVYGATLLHLTVREAMPDAVELLVSRGADVDIADNEGMTPLHHATAALMIKFPNALRNQDAGMDAKSRMLEVAKVLTAGGADVNAKTNTGLTPLHYAAAYGRTEALKLLIANGSGINAKAEGGETPLAFAIMHGNEATAALLRKHGATE